MKNNDYNMNDESNFPLENNGKNPFGLPQDYFSKFEDKLKKKLELENELQEFPLLSSIVKSETFIVPVNYFESTENRVEYNVELETYPKLQSLKKPVFTETEEDYKQQLEFSINHKIEIIEELKSYEILYHLDKVNSFVVAENYFEGVSEKVKDRIYKVKENKKSIIDIVLDIVFGKAMAFSFGLLLIIGLSMLFYKTPESIVETSDCKTLACLERNEILNNNKIITNFDEEQLIDLVDINTLNTQLNSKKQKSEPDTKQNRDSISDDDLMDEL